MLFVKPENKIWISSHIGTSFNLDINVEHFVPIFEEFEAALPLLEEWGVKIEDHEAAFNEIDENGGGQVLFGKQQSCYKLH